MRRQGITQQWENLREQWFWWYGMEDNEVEYHLKHDIYGDFNQRNKSMFNEQATRGLFKSIAEANNLDASALLNNKKAMGYAQELANAIVIAKATESQAASAAVKAAAEKLLAEWNTGEMVNWKTIVDYAVKGVDVIGKYIIGGKLGNMIGKQKPLS